MILIATNAAHADRDATTISTPASLSGLEDYISRSGIVSVTLAHEGNTTVRLAMDAFDPRAAGALTGLMSVQVTFHEGATAVAAALKIHSP